MRRILLWILPVSLLLAGCAAPAERDSAPAQTPAEEVRADPDLGQAAQTVYGEIALGKDFSVTVETPEGDVTELDITEETAWNTEAPAHLLAYSYVWYPASAADWAAQAAPERGNVLTLSSRDGGTVLRCCSGTDLVAWTAGGEEHFALAESPEGNVWDLLVMIPEDAYSSLVWSGTVDGAGTDMEQAAAGLLDQIAERFRSAPDWVRWKPADVRAGAVSIFDVCHGEPENFCCGMELRVLVEGGADEMPRAWWETGSGLGGPDAEGYYGWGREVLVRKNADGDWYCAGYGTGGFSVDLPLSASGEESRLPELVDAFFLTEGFSHDWLVPCYILDQPEERMKDLPALLDRRTEAEARELCGILGECLRESGTGSWTPEDLAAVLGKYGAFLDA